MVETMNERIERECRACGGSGKDALDLLHAAINEIVGRKLLPDDTCRVCNGTGKVKEP